MSTSASNKMTNSLLNEIKAVNKNIELNTKNINVNVGDVEVNTQDLENLFDSYSGAGNNNIGEGSTKLQIYNYGRDVAAGNFKPMVVNSSAEQIVALSSVDNAVLDSSVVQQTAINTKLDSYAGGGNNNIGEGSTKLQIFNYGRDVAAGNYKPMVVNSSAEQIVALSSVDNAVLDAIAVDGDNIQTKLDTLIGHSDGLEGKLDHLSDNSDTLNSSITAVTAAVDALRVQNNGDLNGTIGKLDHISDNLDTIDGSINTLEACVGSNKVNVNISSGGFDGVVSGTVTANLSATDNAVLDAIATDGDNIQTKLDTLETSLTSMEGKQDDMITALQILDNCISGNEAQVDVLTMPTTTVTGTITANLSSTDNAVLDASLVKQTNIETLLTTLDGVQDNILTQITASEVHLSNLDTLNRSNISTGSSALVNSEEVGPIDCSKFSEICVSYLTSTSTTDRQLFITGAITSSGTYHIFAQMNLLSFIGDFTTGAISGSMYGSGSSSQNAEFIPSVYPFIKIKNKTGIDLTDVDDIRIIGR